MFLFCGNIINKYKFGIMRHMYFLIFSTWSSVSLHFDRLKIKVLRIKDLMLNRKDWSGILATYARFNHLQNDLWSEVKFSSYRKFSSYLESMRFRIDNFCFRRLLRRGGKVASERKLSAMYSMRKWKGKEEKKWNSHGKISTSKYKIGTQLTPNASHRLKIC